MVNDIKDIFNGEKSKYIINGEETYMNKKLSKSVLPDDVADMFANIETRNLFSGDSVNSNTLVDSLSSSASKTNDLGNNLNVKLDEFMGW